MVKINNEIQYKAAMERVEELLQVVSDETPEDNKDYVELDLLSALLSDYEEAEYVITTPSLVDVIKLRMYEMGLNQKSLAELLGISPSRLSEFLSGKSEPTLRVAREIKDKLNIDATIILGD